MPILDSKRAEALAKALGEKCLTSDPFENDPNPLWAAQQAFYVCAGCTRPDDWRDWIQLFTSPAPRAAYYRALGDRCHRALRRPNMPNDLREAVAYGWGHFAGLLKTEISRDTYVEEMPTG